MATSPRKGSRQKQPTVAPAAVDALVALLRDLPPSAEGETVRAAVGTAADAVPASARALASAGDDAAIAALAALLTVPDYALPAIEALGHVHDEAAVQILRQVAAAPSTKAAGKAARRALHALAGAGMTVEMPRPAAGQALFQPPPADGVAWSGALGGPIGAEGSRSLLLGQKRLPIGAATAIAVVNEDGGILYFQTAPQTHRQLDKDWQIFLDERPETLAREIPFPYAQWLLGEAADHMTAAGLEVPDEFTDWLEFSGGRPANVSDRFIYDEAGVDPALPPPVSVSSAEALLDEPEIAPWVLPFDAVSGYGAELLSARNSPIVLSEAAQLGREHQIAARAADEQFGVEQRTIYKRRLEETALLFLRSDREVRAQAALATAIALGDTTQSPAEIPFVVALMRRAIEAAAEVEAPTSSEGQAARTMLYGAEGQEGQER
jgi:hypothetical protein